MCHTENFASAHQLRDILLLDAYGCIISDVSKKKPSSANMLNRFLTDQQTRAEYCHIDPNNMIKLIFQQLHNCTVHVQIRVTKYTRRWLQLGSSPSPPLGLKPDQSREKEREVRTGKMAKTEPYKFINGLNYTCSQLDWACWPRSSMLDVHWNTCRTADDPF